VVGFFFFFFFPRWPLRYSTRASIFGNSTFFFKASPPSDPFSDVSPASVQPGSWVVKSPPLYLARTFGCQPSIQVYSVVRSFFLPGLIFCLAAATLLTTPFLSCFFTQPFFCRVGLQALVRWRVSTVVILYSPFVVLFAIFFMAGTARCMSILVVVCRYMLPTAKGGFFSGLPYYLSIRFSVLSQKISLFLLWL